MLASPSRCGFISTICLLLAATLLLPCVAAGYEQQNITKTPDYKLRPGVASVPAPLSVAPAQDWMGIDGEWNTFFLRIGDPGQPMRVLVSTASQQIWAVNSLACIVNVTDPTTGNITEFNVMNADCQESRGALYNTTVSKTWQMKGYYQLWIEKNLGLTGNGLYGFDSVGLGMRGDSGPLVANTTIGTLVTSNFWLGHIGVHAKPTNFSSFDDPVPSYIMDLFDQKSIPSLSFGYTAGAQYRDQTILGSLTLGGYDASRLIPNDLTFIFAPDNERELVVGLLGLTASTANQKDIDLLRADNVTLFIDSTVAELYLPVEICEAFEDTLGLRYDEATDLYLVDDALHQTLLSQNPSVTFTLGQQFSSRATVQITLPYAAFDLEASAPYRGLQEKTRYFPIRRANVSDNWVLGRTFLQEAYLTVDWERQNFTVSAVDWTFGKAPQILPIVSPVYSVARPKRSPSKPLSPTAVIGLAVGGGFFVALVMCAIGLWFWRRRQQRRLKAIEAKYQAQVAEAAKNVEQPSALATRSSTEGRAVVSMAELSSHTPDNGHQAGSDTQEKGLMMVSEADGAERQIYEMPGDIPVRQEADGRQLSEKESMVIRERIYNGVDPSGTPDVAQEPRQRLAPISPSEVSIVSSQVPAGNVSPTTPRTPRDGALLETPNPFLYPPPYRPRDGRRTEADETPISPLEDSTDASRRRFSYES
ncbi:hypothetical protein COCC4DRAFT_193842 [Bipolaris maydis ATCC 48331]|uniref:Peptidase A1 domain-containing protein n=2 Tax=Cochliobolus heterostrophus TaxID=5016 RepID=M2UEN9_COCH5|nr:uncharacterized protein COCC4DRAFT_193842 [Bipolaris maydis ATCC 48331]EMD86458.1 hypothetical protein COCHEDRAFT_71601 [Bipolaris maydis C5]KAH7551873.1 hypothetical protein BM1_09507 [Bipolaris maydis]ENI06408.1 hypothetical protein COCC4DRAFT_193842 [Bipolaris maydis ATCC 48331]KAJ5029888.1 aspartic peptidase domain-containing protein [Bipolaris maydis]KAJ5064892.1 aspartic peptidase domain-containing protein [Bipolaris maydis]